MRTAVSLALLLGVLGAGTAGAAYLLQRRTSPAAAPSTGAPSTATPSPLPTSPAAPSVPVLPPASSVPPSPPVTTMPVAPAPIVLAPSVISPITDVWQRAGSMNPLQYASDSILARLKDPQRQWPGGTPPWIFDERNPLPLLDR